MAHYQNVELVFNAQHDCERLGCQPTGRRALRQERIETDQFITVIEHTREDHYIVNIHSFHRAHLIRKIFDSASYAISPVLDRKALHMELAAITRKPKATAEEAEKDTFTDDAAKGKKTAKGKGKGKGKAIASGPQPGPSNAGNNTSINIECTFLLPSE